MLHGSPDETCSKPINSNSKASFSFRRRFVSVSAAISRVLKINAGWKLIKNLFRPEISHMEAYTPKTASTCTPETAQATHVFDILGYSMHRGMGTDKFISSGTFSVGGHDWSIRFYPDGCSNEQRKNDYISVYLELLGKVDKVRASCDLRLVNRRTRSSSSVHKTELRYFSVGDRSKFAPHTSRFESRSKIEAHLEDDRLTIECSVTVVKEPQVTKTKSFPRIEVPPSDISEHFGKLLEEDQGGLFDVSFRVGRETFPAHRLVLAARSPVFRAELFGPMRETKTLQQHITINDMQPDVFRALLRFIYVDSLDLEGDEEDTEMIRHLLVAADRYAMDRLKLLCQSILCRNLSVDTVATTLALADQHHCDKLMEACLEFITCSDSMDAVVATQGYKNLKQTCPSVIVDALEKAVKSRKA